MLEAVRKAMPGVSVGKILIQRDESDPLKRPIVGLPHSHFALSLCCCL
jgi:uracil phosphoribosyltransferase